jgi:hypothetical protein
LARRSLFVPVLCLALLLVAAAPAGAVTRGQAAKRALASLGSRASSGPVVVFGLKHSLRPGTRVTQAGSKRLVLKVGAERAFLFYEDSTPFALYRHRGRVALVGTRSGKVRLSKTITAPLLVNGKLPLLVSSSAAPDSSIYRVYYRVSSNLDAPSDPSTQSTSTSQLGNPERPNSPPKADRQDATVKQGVPKRITLTGSDDDGDTITFAVTRQPDHGTLSGTPPDLIYTPNSGYLGRDSFTFRTRDDLAQSNTAKVSLTVVPLGSPPSVTTSSGCTAYTEQDPAVVVDNLLTASDPDDTVLDHATVRISANFVQGDDLLFTDQNGITGSYDDQIGVLTLTGTASVASYQTALRSVRYRNLAGGNATATKDIEFTVNDAGSDSAPATKQICIAGGAGGGNNRPIGDTSEGDLSYTENDGPVPADASFVVGDPDSANLSGATIKFIPVVSQAVDENGDPVGPPTTTVTFAPAEDALAFTDQNGISGSYNGSTGVLTLSGSASLADYEAAIRSVTYENSSENPSDALRRLQFQVTDSGGASSIPSRRDIFVTPVNDAPVVATSDGSTSYTGNDPPAAIDSGLTVGDVDDTNIEAAQVQISSGFVAGDQLGFVDQSGISGSYNGDTGVLSLTGTASVADYQAALRSVTYSQTAGNPSGSRTVDFTVNDGDLDSGVASKGLELNDKPVLTPTGSALSYNENAGPVPVDPAITATDADSATLSGATVAITGSFSSAEDSLSFTDQSGITGSYDSNGTLTLSGTASVADYEAALRSVTYENTSDNPSTDTRTVTFQADDGAAVNNQSDPVTRDVSITPVNDAPVVTTSDGSTSYTWGDPATTIDSGLTVGDVDDASIESAQVRISSGFEAGDELVFVDQAGISGVYNTADGILTLTGTAPLADYEAALRSIGYSHTGEDPSASKTVEFTVNDGDVDSNAATKSIDVQPPSTDVAPVVTTSEGSTSYSLADTAGQPVDPGLTVSDADDVNLESARVQIVGFEPGDDLVWADQLGISGSFDSETGVLTVAGSAPVADYETALRSIKFRHLADNVETSRTIEFKVNDGELDSNAATKSIDITP